MPDAAAKQQIKQALAELLTEKDFKKITVQDIVRRAKVSRTTYYYHFYAQQEVLNALFEDVFKHMVAISTKKPYYSCDEARRNVSLMAEYIAKNRALFHALLLGSASEMFKDRYHTFFTDTYCSLSNNNYGETYNKMRAEYLFAGQYQLLLTWFQGDIDASMSDFIDVATDLTLRATKDVASC